MNTYTGAIIPLDVFLNENRNYVQGTQMIARAGDVLLANGILTDAATINSVAFHAITDQTVSLHLGLFDDPSMSLGNITYQDKAESRVTATFVRGEKTAPDTNIPPRCQFTFLEETGPLDARFLLQDVIDVEQFLVALIQAVKDRHQNLSDSVKDIWFTGLRGTAIPVKTPFSLQEGNLSLKFRRMLQKDDTWQTLMSFAMNDASDNACLKGTLTFAFKSETRPDVD